MDIRYRVGVVLRPGDRARYLKGMQGSPWRTTTYRYACNLFTRGAAAGLCDRLNSMAYAVKGSHFRAFIEEA